MMDAIISILPTLSFLFGAIVGAWIVNKWL